MERLPHRTIELELKFLNIQDVEIQTEHPRPAETLFKEYK
jgi:hypothetical protein